MSTNQIIIFFSIFIAFFFPQETSKVFHIPISGDIDMGLPYYIERGIQEANHQSAELIIFEIDTFGGRVDAATKIKDAILSSKIETVAFINRRAISAGALISLSCNNIVMTDGATIGAATAVDAQGEKASEKVISFMREEMASTAEATGKSRQIAEAMVDENIAIDYMISVEGDTVKSDLIKGFSDGKLITLSTINALNLGIADKKLENIDDIIKSHGIEKYEILTVDETWAETLVRFLTNPNVAPLLMSLGMLGLFFEIKSPGFGVPGAIGLLCLGLFFGSHLLVGLADFFELILLMTGIVLILVEIIVIPGFGVAGILGLCLILYSFYSMLIGNYPTVREIEIAYRSLMISITITTILAFFIFKYFVNSKYYKHLVPMESQSSNEGYTISKNYEDMIGEEGLVVSDLRPAGKINIDSKDFHAISQGDYIEKDSKIIIIGVDENQLIVKKT